MATLPEPAARYLRSLEHERRLAAHTLRGYAHELAQLAATAAERPLAALTAADIRGAVVRAHAAGLGARSLAHRLSVWRSFYRWLALYTDLPANPVAAIRAPKRAKSLPKALGVDDTARLLDAAHASSPDELRDHAMLELLYSSGLRVAELAGLDARYAQADGYVSGGWFDESAAEVTVTGKGGRRRSVPVGRQALAALAAWLEVRTTLVKLDPHPLFLSARGQRMSTNGIRVRVKRLALAAGVPADVHPHVLRHSFASHLLQSSGDLRAVQELLGHASIAATQVYTSLDFQHLARVYDSAHPRAKRRS